MLSPAGIVRLQSPSAPRYLVVHALPMGAFSPPARRFFAPGGNLAGACKVSRQHRNIKKSLVSKEPKRILRINPERLSMVIDLIRFFHLLMGSYVSIQYQSLELWRHALVASVR